MCVFGYVFLYTRAKCPCVSVMLIHEYGLFSRVCELCGYLICTLAYVLLNNVFHSRRCVLSCVHPRANRFARVFVYMCLYLLAVLRHEPSFVYVCVCLLAMLVHERSCVYMCLYLLAMLSAPVCVYVFVSTR